MSNYVTSDCLQALLPRGPSDLSLAALHLIERLVVEVVEEGELRLAAVLEEHPEPEDAAAAAVAVHEGVQCFVADVGLPEAARVGVGVVEQVCKVGADSRAALRRRVIADEDVHAGVFAELGVGAGPDELLHVADGDVALGEEQLVGLDLRIGDAEDAFDAV